MASPIYGQIPAGYKDHDELLIAAQTHLLENVKNSGNHNSAKGYAEAYALISGLISSTGPVQKNG